MMNRFYSISYLLLITLSLFSKDIYFNHLEGKDGLPQINVLSIYQDETGAMWFGSMEGLCRYNGKEIQTFSSSKKNEGLTQNIIYSICGDKNGTIYIKANYDFVKYNIIEEKFEVISEGDIKAIYYKDNSVWFVKKNTLFKYSNNKVSKYCDLGNSIGNVNNINILSNGDIWLASDNGITILNSPDIQKKRTLFANIPFNTICVDSKQNIWLGSSKDGVYLLNNNGQIISYFKHSLKENSISNNQIRTIIEDKWGRIWIGTFFGLNKFDTTTKRWTNYIHNEDTSHSISHSSIFSLYEDALGTIWAGTYFGGVNYFNSNSQVLSFYNANPSNLNHLSFPFVGQMTEDKSGNLWICTEGGGLNCLDTKTRKLSHYMLKDFSFESADSQNLKCIWYREDMDKLYIGLHNLGLSIFDIKTKKFKIIPITNENYKFAKKGFNGVGQMQYYKGYLYLFSSWNIIRMDLNSEKLYPFCDDPTVNDLIKDLHSSYFFIDSKDRFWLSYDNGLGCLDLKTMKFKKYTHDPNNPNSIGKFLASTILETKNGDIFLGTIGSGLFKYQPLTDNFKNYTQDKDGLLSDFCYHIAELPSGNLIILNNNAMSIINPNKEGSVVFQSSSNFPLSGFFLGSSVYIRNDHEIFIGGVNGLASLYEAQLSNNTQGSYNLYFDKLYINNKYIHPKDETQILDKTLSKTKNISLKYNQNNFIIEFASSNYLNNTIQGYEYKLEGFDNEWKKASNNILTYTNISPGEYKLYLREIGMEAENKMSELNIVISPPFYASKIAYMLYLILAILSITSIIRFFIWRSHLNAALEFERKEKEQNEKLNQNKLQFFTNISHELRTPLTLIIGQTEIIMQMKDLNAKFQNKVSRIYKNAEHMRNLISELLDFRKQELGFNKLRVEEVNIVEYIESIYQSFIEHSLKFNIYYKIEYPEKEIYVYIDTSQFQKAIYNLLSNAFKYTPSNGEIIVRLKNDNDKNVIIQIEDSGIGIATEDLTKIFDRFYQVEHRSSSFSLGTGIGLALTKEIIQSHKGYINIKSSINKGSLFEIVLPLGKEHFNSDEIIDHKKENYIINNNEFSNTIITTNNNIEILNEINNNNDNSRYSILIVEDNEELLEILTEAFSAKYKVYTAANGREGLEKTLQIQPDLVLSDVMMPEMSGKEMCHKIKNNINISHIPVLLLTAQTSTSQTIEGYMYGADDYITKPFDLEVLLSRCNSLIKNRKLLYESITKNNKSIISFDILNDQDQKFIDKAEEIVRRNFDNPEFDMNLMASELGLGRNKLYGKMKEISGLTPNEFTLNLKLREAIHLLDTAPNLNISEIAFQLGFSTTKYFSKSFKTFYGKSPMQWRQNKHSQEGSDDNQAHIE